jgi:catechol 2,3-dioxygenase-like lactoylglutathione lyase family enzyme
MLGNGIDRRTMLGLLGAAAGAYGADAKLAFTGLDHLEFWATDVEKSRDFYARIFGNTVMKNKTTTRRYIKLGASYLAIDRGQEAGRVDHFCAGIPNFSIEAVHRYLMGKGIAYRDYPSGRDLAVTDPEGNKLQLASDKGWDALAGGTAAAEKIAVEGEPIFRATGLAYVQVNVKNLKNSRNFYAKIFRREPPRVGFSIGRGALLLQETPPGERLGVNGFGLWVDSFDYTDATKRLEVLRAKVETAGGSLGFRDPDGLLVQVRGPVQVNLPR